MDIRYLFITDRITAGKISLEYCPISKMIADFYTKPLQGNMFTKYRDLILNDNLTINNLNKFQLPQQLLHFEL